MSNQNKTKHSTPLGKNHVADAVSALQKVDALRTNSKPRVANKVAIKHQLLKAISLWIVENQFTHSQAAQIMGISSSRLADLLDQQPEEYSVDTLIAMVLRTGKTIQLSINATSPPSEK
ncbi:helix-turn-helix domain-containing protein [Undibacterium parvum]|uniref:XRE family transcriptional regulator n=2 Tax=Undibacterium TaxID=401469 RepID=A0A6M4A3X3_9BURK|nr:XRE family transcriptional regulator [Undibacterium parvum]QJQ05500.1 XRE family transcriptional regulator [Undibacterium piscinae]